MTAALSVLLLAAAAVATWAVADGRRLRAELSAARIEAACLHRLWQRAKRKRPAAGRAGPPRQG